MLEYNKIKAVETDFIKTIYNNKTKQISHKFTKGKVVTCSNGRELGFEKDGTITDIATGCKLTENSLSWFLMYDNYKFLDQSLNILETRLKLA